MNKSNIFKLAHTLTKATIKTGDNYQVTFGAALKDITSLTDKTKMTEKQSNWYNQIMSSFIYTLQSQQEKYALELSCKEVNVDYVAMVMRKRFRGWARKVAEIKMESAFKMSKNDMVMTNKKKIEARLRESWVKGINAQRQINAAK